MISGRIAGLLLSLIGLASSAYVLTRDHRPDPAADPVAYAEWADARAFERAIRLTPDQLEDATEEWVPGDYNPKTGGFNPFYKLSRGPRQRWCSSRGSIAWQIGTIHIQGWGDGPSDCPQLLRAFMQSGDPHDLPTPEELASTMSRDSEGQVRVRGADSIIHCLVRPRDEQYQTKPGGGPVIHWKLVRENR